MEHPPNPTKAGFDRRKGRIEPLPPAFKPTPPVASPFQAMCLPAPLPSPFLFYLFSFPFPLPSRLATRDSPPPTPHFVISSTRPGYSGHVPAAARPPRLPVGGLGSVGAGETAFVTRREASPGNFPESFVTLLGMDADTVRLEPTS